MKLNALIVDDEHSGRAALEILLKENFSYIFEKLVTASSLNGAIEIVSQQLFDFCFLDIELNDQSGFDLLPHLPSETKVVFVTAYSEYAIRALREKAYDYLLKPIQPEELMDCIKRFEAETRKQPERFLLVKQQGFTIPVALDEIVYLEAKGPYSKICLINNNQYLMSKTLKVLTDLLSNDFIRIHRSFLVNKAMIQSFKKDNLITITNVCLPVSRLGSKILSQYF